MSNLNLKMAIIKSGKRQFQIAREAGMHPSVFSHYLNEHYPAPQEHQEAIASALGVEVDEIFQDGATEAV